MLAYGGAVNYRGTTTVTINDCVFKGNKALKQNNINGLGGAIKFNTGTWTIDGCTFSGNTATKGDANGHDIKMSTTTTLPTIKNSTFNTANVRDSEGTANAYKDGGGNKQ